MKFELLIATPHPNPPDERLAVLWMKILRTNDTDEFVRELSYYLRQSAPIRVNLSKDLTSGELRYYRSAVEKMEADVNAFLKENDLPTLTRRVQSDNSDPDKAKILMEDPTNGASV